jgi:hypothetical protein
MEEVKESKMGEEKKEEEKRGEKGKGRRGEKKVRGEKKPETALTIAGVPIKIDKRYEKMSVVEALQKEGVLPINPLEVVDEDTSMYLGSQAGTIYGASIYTLGKAFIRDDLPLDKRVRLGLKGVRPILSMIFQAVDTYNRFGEIEESILSGEAYEEIENKIRSRRRLTPTAQEVIADLQQRLKEVEEEKVALEAKLSGKKPNVRKDEEPTPDSLVL